MLHEHTLYSFACQSVSLVAVQPGELRPHGDNDGVVGVAWIEEEADESDVAGAPTQRPRKLSKRGRARCGTDRTGFILAVLRRRGG